MKKIITFISLVMVFLPWTIFPLRTNPWALQSPAAEIIVYSYAAFMIFSADLLRNFYHCSLCQRQGKKQGYADCYGDQ